MERAPDFVLHPALLPAGTVVGRWRVVAWGGQGVHGAVYRAVRVGQEQGPGGMLHPFLVIDWVDGAPLYEQALYPRTSPHVARMLAQLARALAELHALGAVHRDIKGENILVRYGDGRAAGPVALRF